MTSSAETTPAAAAPLGRRERNKQQKLERIVAAAAELFAEHGVDEVTTQQIAERADIGTGTLFLYAKTKGELLLLVQNAHYEEALARGRHEAESAATALDAVLAVLAPIAECNRVQVENGRTYLREMAFGDPTEPHHAAARAIAAETDSAMADILVRRAGLAAADAATLAGIVSAVMFLTLATSADPRTGVAEIVAAVRAQVAAILPH
ncbi:TetR/AcrR family transcriptional regulator [Rathayibacter sp. Leaf296]|uniref:TetR/AcrR family transcriptional regulator n=1 Tax=Rathayibacter sp. Leaf296 TaxID=1736327 RepID=UPI0007025F5E|nr:TetR/AcrR family transcriptional regulator [Rathayibacter sp. Leaf296]KQQ08731.1 TetR family transcriptional regulator [Rathayibacter sp. Leaf296]